MGFWDFLRRPDPVPVAYFTPNVNYIGAEDLQSMMLGDLTPAQMWATQPHLRTVVSFLARNIAQLGLHSFKRNGEDRQRDLRSTFAVTMRRPNPDQTAYDLVYGLVGDLALYDRAYWMLAPDATGPSGWMIRRLPPSWVTPNYRDSFSVESYGVLGRTPDEVVTVPAEDVIAFTGYHPADPRKGSPTVESLKGTLQEQIEAAKYRAQVWKRGGRVSAVLKRPIGSPDWSPEARERFREDWYSTYSGDGPRAGGTPLLEDGMDLQTIDFSAKDQQFVEATKLSFATVAAGFHVNPTMVGILDNANYSNVREFRRMLYGDTLGPLIAQIEGRINTFLLPRLGMNNQTFYTEFNIAEKLQGSFEEQASVMQTLVGAPLMTRNEGRSKFNLPALPDGEGLVTPLNVLIGGQASPTDSGSQNELPKSITYQLDQGTHTYGSTPRLKAGPSDNHRTKVEQVLSAFFDRQGKVVLARLGAGADWWDDKRWNKELSEDLLRVSHTLASLLGKAEADRLGFPDGYDPDRTVNFLQSVSERQATNINETTQQQVQSVIDSGEGEPADVFDMAKASRAAGIAVGVAGFVAGFSSTEAGKQIAFDHNVEPVKTWHTGHNPRGHHARMDGETVPINETFSNGMDWPGGGGPDDIGCNCSVSVTIP